MRRATSTEFFKKVEWFEQVLGQKLATNVWHQHFSVYTQGENGSNNFMLVSSNTARDAIDQIDAALRTLQILRKTNEE
jgi:hypothetical protein